MPSAVDRVRFAQWAKAAFDQARARGMSTATIEKETGIALSTIYRWFKGAQAPSVDKIRQYCAGLGIDDAEALKALGVGAQRAPTPPAPMDPDVAKLLRKLADPNVNADTKAYILRTLQMLANMPDIPAAAASTSGRRGRRT